MDEKGTGDGNSPWWVTAGFGIVAVVLAVLRVYDFYRLKRDEGRERRIKLDATEARETNEQQKEARRDAATEAWEVVDRLTREIEGCAEKIKAIEERERQCIEDRAVLRMVAAWAMRQKNPPPIPQSVLARLSDGSATHPPVEGTGT